jgi:hypothetical protein
MKFGKLIICAASALVAVAAAVAAVVYFKDEILEFLGDARKKFELKKTKLFCNNEYTDYADI